eukprot:TRINITY_DN9108_c0_g1_i1.p1 TRINITY_DN9108_c0_g1~~TRINITY_DN9108_c0_g1_i1.p1  ORF type:complete len:326 (-),score=64.13 TRINITY_DN9108_c0_g1_i1:1005-1982(-)
MNGDASTFQAVTGSTQQEALQFLSMTNYNLNEAITLYLSSTAPASMPPPKPVLRASGYNKVSVLIGEQRVGTSGIIQVRHGDITEEQVDVIVNPANDRLDHASGVAGAIRKKGGPIIQHESDEYIAIHGRLNIGDVIAAHHKGEMKCKQIFHAVGPTWRGGSEGEEVFLSMCVRSCFDKALQLGHRSISLPAISTGIFNFPKDKCAALMFDIAVQFLGEIQGNDFHIRFTNFDDETVFIFKSEFERRFPNDSVPVHTPAIEPEPVPAPALAPTIAPPILSVAPSPVSLLATTLGAAPSSSQVTLSSAEEAAAPSGASAEHVPTNR